jgi:hypothetical protein
MPEVCCTRHYIQNQNLYFLFDNITRWYKVTIVRSLKQKTEVIMKKLLLSLTFLSLLPQFLVLNAQKPRFYFGSQELTLAQAQALIAQHDPQQAPQAHSKAGQKLQKPKLPRKPTELALSTAFAQPTVPPKPRKQAPAKAFPATHSSTTGPNVSAKISFFQHLGQ